MSSEIITDEMRLLQDTGVVHDNLSVPSLIELALARNEGRLTSTGALQVLTGKYSGRSPKDKYIVDEPGITNSIHWGSVNRPISEAHFLRMYEKAQNYMNSRDVFVFDGFAGGDREYQMKFRVVTELAWHNLFMHQLLVRPTADNPFTGQPDFTIIDLPGLKADPAIDGTSSETFILISFERKIVLIGGTMYAGEMKKSVFSILNGLMPMKDMFPMHCSANIGEKGDVALFFGLSGTGKTTLSADPARQLIGDDEHVWSDKGVYNIEGGCYAKCIGLSAEKEPMIWDAIKYGTVLENVVVDSVSRITDYDDNSYTENTRAAYPLDYIPNAFAGGAAGHPNTIVFLTADAFGVLPPVAKLTKPQAIYHFLSGYTSKLAGTERGVTDPEATFSACFGEPFLPLNPGVYADLLSDKITRHNVDIYLINTGWIGGPYGIGERINLRYTRAMVTAALDGTLKNASYAKDPVFGLPIPDSVPGVPVDILQPINAWDDKSNYMVQARKLALLFNHNFEKFISVVPEDIAMAGPVLT
ncbi:phosphoenolpyruvate carboxykinase (ATP) [Paenibacillus sp. 453mf]|uniref:phosphoenolpyruvate carboxykinase (ATP) n=1 Tax=Paenibacillus sp. 453mf TaxID=1761874 RepID=UPI0008E67AFF|nr:phosphoenolpyruvate carboxykinase (ATP) [Paenibacillus sp. 453mf]SFS77023.1 phosphoenolpyruvate carboxykinase (ATP) [Paenibacillus sp. 453mf]